MTSAGGNSKKKDAIPGAMSRGFDLETFKTVEHSKMKHLLTYILVEGFARVAGSPTFAPSERVFEDLTQLSASLRKRDDVNHCTRWEKLEW